MKRAATILVASLAALAIPTGVHADGLTVNAEATCTAFTIHVEGLASGDRVFVEQGSNPPAWPTVSEAGTVDIAIPAAMNPWFTADVLVQHDGQLTNLYHALVDCARAAPADPSVPVVAEPDPQPEVKADAIVERPRRITERLTRFGLR